VSEPLRSTAPVNELTVLKKRGRLIYHAIRLSTTSALLVCFLIATIFASSMLPSVTRLIVSGLFISAMLASIVSLMLFLREVSYAIETFEVDLPGQARQFHGSTHVEERCVTTAAIPLSFEANKE
jgi:hypothetical protein